MARPHTTLWLYLRALKSLSINAFYQALLCRGKFLPIIQIIAVIRICSFFLL